MKHLNPLPADQVVWEGRPAVRVTRADVLAGVAVFAVCLAVLGPGLQLGFGVAPGRAAPVAALYAGVGALVLTFARAVGAGVRYGAAGAFLACLAMASLTRDEGASLAVVCSFLSAGAVGVMLVWRTKQRQRTRYRLTKDRGAVGEENRYVITFHFAAPVRVIPDRFGSDLADVVLTIDDVQLITRDGKIFRMPSKVYRLHRVQAPAKLLEALGSA